MTLFTSTVFVCNTCGVSSANDFVRSPPVRSILFCRVKVAVNVLSAPVAHQLAGIVPVVVSIGTFLAVRKVFPVIHFEKSPPFLFASYGFELISFIACCFYPRFSAILALTAILRGKGIVL